MFKPTDITLYVPCFNVDQEDLKKVAAGLLAQTARPAEIILFDDASPNPLVAPDPSLTVIRNHTNIGLAATRNQAVESCNTALLASLDADVVPEPDWLEQLLAAHNAGEFAGVGGKLIEACQETIGDQWRSIHMAQHWGDEPIRDPRFLYGCNNLYRVDVLKQCSYNPRLKTNYEDMSLSESLYQKGLHLFYQPRAVCRHLRKDSESSILQGFWKWYHAKGLLEGQFAEPGRLIERMDKVNFGIYRYRYDLDADQQRPQLLQLDCLIPWVFCYLDLTFAEKTCQLTVPQFPTAELLARLSGPDRQLLADIIGPGTAAAKSDDWHSRYLDAFRHCLEKWHWGE